MKAKWVAGAALGATLALVAASWGGTNETAGSTAGLRVGMVTDASGLNDRGFNHLAYIGLQQAQRRLGAQVQVAESKTTADYIPNLASFARRGYDLVIGVGYTEIGA